nr:GNAT family N-acetyltransferase [uncultured Methanobacterium sp.]
MLEIKKYDSTYKNQWDIFVSSSKNGFFLFYREYMEYHSDRFVDSSLMFFKKNKLVAILPANIYENVLYSHGGLTFGGIISDKNMKTSLMLDIFKSLKNYLKGKMIKKIVYKAIPHIYHILPAEEDLYAIFVDNGKLIRRDVSSAVFLEDKISFTKGKIWNVKKSRENGLEICRSYDFESFMEIEKENLKKYDAKPVHTAKEMELLASRFPDNIKLFTAHKEGYMLSGVIIYESNNVAHTQYIGATDEGMKLYSTDLIMDYLINDYYKGKKYFDFGISTEKDGFYLNEGLIGSKERFGARAIVHDFYEITID